VGWEAESVELKHCLNTKVQNRSVKCVYFIMQLREVEEGREHGGRHLPEKSGVRTGAAERTGRGTINSNNESLSAISTHYAPKGTDHFSITDSAFGAALGNDCFREGDGGS
jgi:hypothetical protein